jgi:hypothetical protein
MSGSDPTPGKEPPGATPQGGGKCLEDQEKEPKAANKFLYRRFKQEGVKLIPIKRKHKIKR